MLLASRKNEMQIRHKLNIGSKQCFHFFLWIFSYLLKLINGDYTLFLRYFQIVENIFEGCFFLAWFNMNAEFRISCYRVEPYDRTKTFHGRSYFFCYPL